MNILFITTVLPGAKTTGGEVATYSFVECIQKLNYNITVAGYSRTGLKDDGQSIWMDLGRRAIETRGAKLQPILWLVTALVRRLPYSVAKYFSRSALARLKDALGELDIDIVFIDHAQMGWIADYINLDKKNTILIAHNVEHAVYTEMLYKKKNIFEKLLYRREANLMARFEQQVCKKCSQIWCLSKNDEEYFRELDDGVYVTTFDLPTPDINYRQLTIEKTTDVGLLGSWTWQSNAEGLKWFVKNIYPELPDSVTVSVAGKGAQKIVKDCKKIKYEGFVADPFDFMLKCKVFAIPSVAGSGIQIKTLEAISTGTNIVATKIALRGIENYPDNVVIANTPKEFVLAVLKLLENDNVLVSAEKIFSWVQSRNQKFYRKIRNSLEYVEKEKAGSRYQR